MALNILGYNETVVDSTCQNSGVGERLACFGRECAIGVEFEMPGDSLTTVSTYTIVRSIRILVETKTLRHLELHMMIVIVKRLVHEITVFARHWVTIEIMLQPSQCVRPRRIVMRSIRHRMIGTNHAGSRVAKQITNPGVAERCSRFVIHLTDYATDNHAFHGRFHCLTIAHTLEQSILTLNAFIATATNNSFRLIFARTIDFR